MTTWAATLDAFEARLVEQRAALDAGHAGALEPFQPPRGLGPLPATHLERARRLVRESEDLVEELSGNVVALAQDLAVVRALEASTAMPATARFVDFSA